MAVLRIEDVTESEGWRQKGTVINSEAAKAREPYHIDIQRVTQDVPSRPTLSIQDLVSDRACPPYVKMACLCVDQENPSEDKLCS